MDEFIARANIEHFHKLLAETTDEADRQVISQLLAEEEGKLAAALNRKRRAFDDQCSFDRGADDRQANAL